MKKSKNAWETLQTTYQGFDKITLVRLQTVQRDLKNLRMREDKSTHVFITRYQTIINHLKNQGETITEKKVVENILRPILPKFDLVVIAIEKIKDTFTFKIKELRGS